eukprot:TRINITY_DN1260_c0_g1_i3.p1 TRINITY_DN1260_c0_g1~~TRINITY_DN1260_c0_g1_i3.p1  ORF type:complete len:316 (-),score=63.95 TRINITY_DN1260_c0_g1_i3:47-994(-)
MFKGKIDGIDLNCGCPQTFALQKHYGCGMWKDPENLIKVCSEIVKGVPYPVSIKLRLYNDVPTTIEVLKKIRDVGVKAFTVHGRYWWQKGEKRGDCDWESIRMIREAFPDMPIIGNGDVKEYSDFERFKRISGVDSVMSGYGALLNPAVFSSEPVDIGDVITKYISIVRRHKGKWVDVLRHVGWMVKRRCPNTKEFKANLFQSRSFEDIKLKLSTLDPPIIITIEPLPEGIIDQITYTFNVSRRNKRKRSLDTDLIEDGKPASEVPGEHGKDNDENPKRRKTDLVVDEDHSSKSNLEQMEITTSTTTTTTTTTLQ